MLSIRIRRCGPSLVLAAMTLGVAGCGTGGAQVAEQPQTCSPVPAADAEQPLQLLACMLDAEVQAGDPIRVFVALANTGDGPVLTRARLDLGSFLLITVEDEAGQNQDMWVGEPGHFDEATTDITLPRGGIVGRVINLTCDPGGYRSADAPCFAELDINQPGTYRIALSYAVLCGLAGCPPDHPWVGTLSAPPLEFRVIPND
jgi:hypothetical protein